MFGWRRKSEGFKWQKYVRTTIRLRRKGRAEKIEEIKNMAASGAKAAGRQSLTAGHTGLSALRYAIVRLSNALWRGALRLSHWLGRALRQTVRLPGVWLTGAASWLWRRARHIEFGVLRLPTFAISARQKIAALFGGLGLLAGLSAYLQFLDAGAAWSTLLAALVAVVLLGLAASPWLKRLWHFLTRWAAQLGGRLASLPRGGFSVPLPPMKYAGAAAAVVVAASAAIWAWQSNGLQSVSSSVLAALPSWSSLPSVKAEVLPDISGRARAVTGDTLRLHGRLVRLAGIEAPEISQICRNARKRAWRCGYSARNTLRRAIRRKKVVCTDVTKADGGRLRATCRIGDRDLAAYVVRKGYAFAQGAIFKTYADAEASARDAKRGVWRGEVQRPAEFRSERWAKASKRAPDGCPIKGRVVRDDKVYVLPWASEYRRVRIRRRRGERWFCSEEEATNAGFRPSSTG